MGKKNKKLKKKNLSQSAARPTAPNQPIADSVVSAGSVAAVSDQVIASPQKQTYDEAEFIHVRGDVKRILLLLAVIIAVLFIIYFVDTKTHFLNSTADWLYKILNIQTQ